MTSFTDYSAPAASTRSVALTAQSGVAAGTGDNTELTSAGVNRIPVGQPGLLSAALLISYLTSIAASQTLKATVKISESDDGTSWGADETIINAQTIETGAVAAKYGCFELPLDLTGRKVWVRFKITLDLSAGATDTFTYVSTLVLGRSDKHPV